MTPRGERCPGPNIGTDLNNQKQSKMRTVIVPTFDEFNRYAFAGSVEVKIKNKPTWEDRRKIEKHLPGICQGAVGPEPLKKLIESGEMDVRSFYDARQNTKMLRGYKVVLKN